MEDNQYSDIVRVLHAIERLVALDATMRDAAGLAARTIEALAKQVEELRSQRGQVLEGGSEILTENATHLRQRRDDEGTGAAQVLPAGAPLTEVGLGADPTPLEVVLPATMTRPTMLDDSEDGDA